MKVLDESGEDVSMTVADGLIENEEAVVLLADWKTQIQHAWYDASHDENGVCVPNQYNQNFLDMIWEMSLTAFNFPREVQVVIDSKDDLYMSFGTGGYVDFPSVMQGGMKLPIKCWIHTHPFGQAYFSGTDWKTIKTWQSKMQSAIVLGNNQHMVWKKENTHTVFYRRDDNLTWSGEEE